MARKRFDTAPEFKIYEDSVVFQQVTGSSSAILEVKNSGNSTIMQINSSGEILGRARDTEIRFFMEVI